MGTQTALNPSRKTLKTFLNQSRGSGYIWREIRENLNTLPKSPLARQCKETMLLLKDDHQGGFWLVGEREFAKKGWSCFGYYYPNLKAAMQDNHIYLDRPIEVEGSVGWACCPPISEFI